MLTHRFTWK